MIVIENIQKSFGSLKVLKGISLAIPKAEFVSLVGPSGAGKTTLLQILGTLQSADSGSIVIDNSTVSAMAGEKLAAFRNSRIGFVFQFHHLLPEFTALENVMLPAMIAGRARKQAAEEAQQLLGLLAMQHRSTHRPSQLSGGEQQRVAVARALINQPAVILADEPSGNLDSKNKQELHELFLSLRAQFNLTFVIVTHDEGLAQMSDRVIHITDGIISGDTKLN